ncbi:HWE histidine kinase domain-containing protein [Methylobacterium iners]|uniref:histidine kinase n=1 Tax=Methylobacterium iners TaxID=418707 RepID=A0ABQ4S491_9HYPH|nr:HWE histidine kinase domain-containing protein [Methylobacterium iners]GJD97288.1 Blue-light-activated histidine kinase [Methylobacterium iners]
MSEDTGAARIAELEADNRRLRRLLDQRDAPGELRHRLRNTLAMLRIVIRRSAETERDRDEFVAHLQDRLDAIARAQAAIDSHGWIDLHTLLADELLYYGASEGDRVTLSGPDIALLPKAGQVLAMAIHELAVNAVEHGSLGAEAGRIDVAWHVANGDADPFLTLTWKESGLTSTTEPAHRGFGTEVLTRVLAYEFKAETAFAFEPDGLRCTITLLLPPQVGQVSDP